MRLPEKHAFRNFMNYEAHSTLMSLCEIAEYDPEEPIVREGELDQHFFGIMEGTVAVSVRQDNGRDVFMCSLGAGDVFGEAGFFLNIKRTATVTSQGKTVTIRMKRTDITAILCDHPIAGNKILLVTIYGLLRKLKATNHELAYERRADMDQDDVDSMVNGLLGTD